MITLLLLGIIGLGMALFATQNISPATVTLANYTLTGVPVYLVVIISILAGIVMSFVISLVTGLSSTLSLHRKDSLIQNSQATIEKLQKENHQLSLENARLKKDEKISTVHKEDIAQDEDKHSSLLSRLAHTS